MLHKVYSRRNKVIPLLGFLFILVMLPIGTLLNQTYLQPAHAASVCQGPPAGFDPVSPKVTNAQLRQYGMPPRPSASKQPNEYAFWLNMVRHAKHRVCTTSTSTKLSFSGTSAVAPLSLKTANLVHSNNYSGYTATSSGVTYVSGTWEVPCEHQTQNNNHTGTIQDLIQVGFPYGNTLLAVGTQEAHTETNQGNNITTGTDKDQYVIYFNGPGGGASFADATNFPIKCGDSVSAVIGYDNSVSPAQWNADITDNATNSSFSMTYTAGRLPNSAFWGEYTSAYPLYNFGTVPWSGSELAGSSGLHQSDAKPIAQWSNSPVQMVNSAGRGLAHPSDLDSTGAGFTDNWQNLN